MGHRLMYNKVTTGRKVISMINLLLILCSLFKFSVCILCAVFALYIINYDYGEKSCESTETDCI